jgi:hypothetical protein
MIIKIKSVVLVEGSLTLSIRRHIAKVYPGESKANENLGREVCKQITPAKVYSLFVPGVKNTPVQLREGAR